MSLRGNVVVITGGSSGIGAELGKAVVAQGGHIVLASRRVDVLEQIKEICGGDQNVLIVKCDVTVRQDHEDVLEAAVARFGKIDVWVNNAGVGMTKKALDIKEDDFDFIMNVNCKSVLFGMQTAASYFKSVGSGHIINISSLLGRIPYIPLRSIYSAAKHAVNSLTCNVRVDLKNEGFDKIHVSLFSPGVVATEFGNNSVGGGPDSRAIPGAQSVEEVASEIVNLIINPAADVYSRPAYQELVARYFSARDISAVESNPCFSTPRFASAFAEEIASSLDPTLEQKAVAALDEPAPTL